MHRRQIQLLFKRLFQIMVILFVVSFVGGILRVLDGAGVFDGLLDLVSRTADAIEGLVR